MNKVKLMTLMSFFIAGVSWAQSGAGTQASVSRSDASEMSLKDEVIGVVPQVGVVGYVNGSGSRKGRAVAGMGFDFNAAPALGDLGGKDYFLGLSTGLFYSHMGSAAGNFLGDNSATREDGGANLILIPADLKVGYNFTPSFRGSLHGGGNILYRSAANSADTGDGQRGDNSLWRVYPNAGADLELQVGKHVSLIARPDVTFTSGPAVLMGTVGATFIPSI